MDYAFNRRRFITVAGTLLSLNVTAAFSAANSAHSSDIKLGVASYSLRKLSRAQAIAALKELKTPYLNIKEFHLLYSSTPTELEAGRKVTGFDLIKYYRFLEKFKQVEFVK